MSAAIAAGVPVYTRGRALELFLESVPEYVTTVYVAENGTMVRMAGVGLNETADVE